MSVAPNMVYLAAGACALYAHNAQMLSVEWFGAVAVLLFVLATTENTNPMDEMEADR